MYKRINNSSVSLELLLLLLSRRSYVCYSMMLRLYLICAPGFIDVQSPGVFILLAVLFVPPRHPRASVYMLAKKNVDDIKSFCRVRVLRSALGATAELNRCSRYALI